MVHRSSLASGTLGPSAPPSRYGPNCSESSGQRSVQLHCDMATVIVGAGIIGCSTAFYLTQPPSATDPSTVHLVESSPELFASASGYGAGFLARDWFSDSVASLGALSFDLHKELAAKHNGAEHWGYSRSTGTSLVQVKGQRGDEWLREGTSRAETAGSHQFYQGHGPAWLTRSNNGKVEVVS